MWHRGAPRHGDCACAVWLVISCPGQLALSLGPGHRLIPQCAFSLSRRPEVALARAPSPAPSGLACSLADPWRPFVGPGGPWLVSNPPALLSCPTTSPYLCLHVTFSPSVSALGFSPKDTVTGASHTRWPRLSSPAPAPSSARGRCRMWTEPRAASPVQGHGAGCGPHPS